MTQVKLKDIKEEVAKSFVVSDPYIMEVLMGTVTANTFVDGAPVWLMLAAPSSGGKSTLLSPFRSLPICHFLDDFTEKTMLSGYKVKGKEMSLLKKIGSGILFFSDFTTMLTKNSNSKGEILTQLRMIYDGNFSKQTGTGEIKWAGKMGLIAACTPAIYNDLESAASMGERYSYYYMNTPSDQEVAERMRTIRIRPKDFAFVVGQKVDQYFKDLADWCRAYYKVENFHLTPEQEKRIEQAALFCIRAKAVVRTDFKSRKPDRIPEKASIGRDLNSYINLLQGIHRNYCYEEGNPDLPLPEYAIEIIEKMAWSSINREKRKVLEILAEHGETLSASQIGARKGFGLEKDAVEKYLAPLYSVGIVDKIIGKPFKWRIGRDEDRVLIATMSKYIIEDTPKTTDKDDNFTDDDIPASENPQSEFFLGNQELKVGEYLEEPTDF